jgi:hypothetical protein
MRVKITPDITDDHHHDCAMRDEINGWLHRDAQPMDGR